MTANTTPHIDPTVRHDMVFFFDVADGNPNGDPDAGNRPRMDDESGHGLVTDVALKRKIRDTLPMAAGEDRERYGIFVEADHALNTRIEEAYHVHGLQLEEKGSKRTRTITPEQAEQARAWLCHRYADIRLFGAVLSVGKTNALGQIRGPLQTSMARSIDPVFPIEHAITRVTQTRQEDIDKGETTEMGNKWTVPYALYRAELSYSANRAWKTGVDSRDFELLYTTLQMMFDHDRTASRGTMTARGLYVFSHSNAFGDAPAHKLTERVRATRSDGGTSEPPRQFNDYTVSVDDDGLPDGVTFSKIIA